MEVNWKMPRGDRTGPWGLGPRTGRAAGYCAGYPVPGFMNPIPGFGRGYGRGWGRGYGRGFGRRRGRRWLDYPPQYPYAYPPPMIPVGAPPQSAEQELAAIKEYRKELEAEKADLEKEMNEAEARISELKTKLQGKGQPQKP